MPMTVDQFNHIVKDLRQDPLKFLQQFKVKIAGGSRNGPSGPIEWRVGYKNADDQSVIMFNAANMPNTHVLRGHAVAMHNFDGEDRSNSNRVSFPVLAYDSLPSHELGNNGPDFMTTGQLTACSFAMMRQGNNVHCLHFEPGSQTKSGPLRTQLMSQGRFAGFPNAALTVIGASDYQPNVAYIIGIRTAGKWKIYAQIRPNDDSKQITKALKIL